jgi:hypothetical protein
MPITNELRGKKMTRVIEFGAGDIAITPSIEPNNELWFWQTKPRPMAEWGIGKKFDMDGPQQDTDEVEMMGEPIILKFRNKKSMLVLKEAIEAVYKQVPKK